MLGQVLEFTLVLVMAFLILANADAFGQATRAVADLYTNSVRTLQGR